MNDNIPLTTRWPFKVGDRILSVNSYQMATVTGLTIHGFNYELDEEVHLGVRIGSYKKGECYELGYDEWILRLQEDGWITARTIEEAVRLFNIPKMGDEVRYGARWVVDYSYTKDTNKFTIAPVRRRI